MEARSVNWYLVAGASLYWASALATLLFSDTRYGGGLFAEYGEQELFQYLPLSTAGLILVTLLLSRHFRSKRVRLSVLLIALSASTLILTIALVPQQAVAAMGSGTTIAIYFILRLLESIALILFWSLAFVSLKKNLAGGTVAVSALTALLLWYAAQALTQLVPLFLIVEGMRILSFLILLSGKITFSFSLRTSSSPARQVRLTGFYVSRAIIGMGIGILLSLMLSVPLEHNLVLLAVGLGILAVGILFFALSKDRSLTALPLIPLFSSLLIILPFLGSGFASASEPGGAMLWFFWILLSSFQLSDIRERCRFDEIKLCFSEKAVIMLSWSLSIPVSRFISDSVGMSFSEQTMRVILVIILWLALVGISYAFFFLVHTRAEDSLTEQIAKTQEEYLLEGYAHIAKKYRLSPREREIMLMLAQGYSRSFIKEAFFISEGTARSHIAHIYQKLGVHKKDEFLCLVKEEMGVANRKRKTQR